MKKLLIAFMCVLVVFSVSCELSDLPMDEIIKEEWNGTDIDISWYDADESEFELVTAEDLAGFASLVNAGNDFNGKTVRLGADINLSNFQWTPIGTLNKEGPNYSAGKDWSAYRDKDFFAFKGTFDGNGYTVSNLKYEGTSRGGSYIGLFGVIADGAIIRNLNINNVDISGNDALNVGSVVGYLTGSSVSGRDNKAELSNIKVSGRLVIDGLVTNSGGIIGRAAPSTQLLLDNCRVDVSSDSYIVGTSSTTTNFIGGIIGVAYGTSEDSALVMNNCYSNIDVVGYCQAVGGLAGAIFRGSVTSCTVDGSEITLYPYKGDNCYDHLSVGAVTGCVGNNTNLTISSCTGATTINSYLAEGEDLLNDGYAGTRRTIWQSPSSELVTCENNSITIKHTSLSIAE